MGKKLLTVEISEELYNRFYSVVQPKGGPWRSRREAAYKAIESAVEIALTRFLDSLEEPDKGKG